MVGRETPGLLVSVIAVYLLTCCREARLPLRETLDDDSPALQAEACFHNIGNTMVSIVIGGRRDVVFPVVVSQSGRRGIPRR